MIIDANELGDAAPLGPYDVCVVGSGFAGLVVAHELSRHGLRLCVLESGERQRTAHAAALKAVVSEGEIAIKPDSRERVLGGTSATWDGLSAPLDPIDLAPRPWVPRSGWPLADAELERYYAAAAARYGFPDPALFRDNVLAPVKAAGDRQPAWRHLCERPMLAPTRPPRLAQRFRAFLEGPTVDVYTDASVVELLADRARGVVTAAEIRTRGRRVHRVPARVFVLAAGGIENPRLLLLSTQLCPAGLGNEHDQVGRCFMNHPKNPAGLVAPLGALRHLPAYFGCLYRGWAGYLALRLDDATQARLEVLNSCVRLEPLYPWSDRRAVQLLLSYLKAHRRLWERLQAVRGDAALRDYAETGDDPAVKIEGPVPSAAALLAAVAREPGPVAHYLVCRLLDRLVRPRVRAIRIRNFMEMAPDPDNRVLLAEACDAYGKPRALVRHSTTPLDRRSLVALHQVLAEELAAAGLGRLVSSLSTTDPWPITADASHHLGATRMGTDPRTSVVTPECRLHTVPNVYVAGGSVFPTGGSANPTYTIVALAIRLAEHLARTLAPRPAPALATRPSGPDPAQ